MSVVVYLKPRAEPPSELDRCTLPCASRRQIPKVISLRFRRLRIFAQHRAVVARHP